VWVSSPTMEVGQLAVRLWRRELASLFKVSENRVKVFGVVALALCIFYGVVLAMLGSSQLGADIPRELSRSLVRTSLGGAVMTTGIVSTVLCISVPPRTALRTLLDLLPVSRRQAEVGQLLPVLVLGFVFSAALSAISLSVGWRILPSRQDFAAFACIYLMVVASTELIVVGVFSLIRDALRVKLRLPQQYSQVIAGGASILLVLASAAPDVFSFGSSASTAFEAKDLLLHRAGANVVTGEADARHWAIAVAWIGVAAASLWATGSFRSVDIVPGGLPIAVGVKPRKGSFRAAVWFETLVAIRTPQALVTGLVLFPAVGALWWLSTVPFLRDVALTLAAGIPIMPFLIAVYAVGRSMRVRWIGALATASRGWWISPTIVAHALIGLCLAVPVVVVESLLQLIGPDDLWPVASRCLFALSASLFAGAVVPFSEEQPLSATVAGFLAAIVYLGGSFAAQGIVTLSALLVPELSLTAFALAILFAYYAVLRRQDDEELRRAS
jgi:hypothetical protein